MPLTESLPPVASKQDGELRRPEPAKQPKTWLFWVGVGLTALYMGIVAFMTLWPVHIDDNAAGGLLHDLINKGHATGLLPGWFTYNLVEWISNVVMFMPGGFLLCLLLKPPVRFWVPVVGMCTSVGIETIQFFMPDRTSSLLDVLANSLGAFLGWMMGVIVLDFGVKRHKNR